MADFLLGKFAMTVPCRDTSTTESEIPSFRDAKPHESWELVPLDELAIESPLHTKETKFPSIQCAKSPLGTTCPSKNKTVEFGRKFSLAHQILWTVGRPS